MDRRYVGIDLHRRRSVIYAMDAAGDRLFCERIDNEPMRLLELVGRAGVSSVLRSRPRGHVPRVRPYAVGIPRGRDRWIGCV
jgi:hypothetical protein